MMKLLLLSTVILLASCNNDTTSTDKTSTEKTTVTRPEKDNAITAGKSWTDEDKKRFMDGCVMKPGGDKGGTKEGCECLLEKAQQYFTNFESYDRNKEDNPEWVKNGEAFDKAADECRQKFPGK